MLTTQLLHRLKYSQCKYVCVYDCDVLHVIIIIMLRVLGRVEDHSIYLHHQRISVCRWVRHVCICMSKCPGAHVEEGEE